MSQRLLLAEYDSAEGLLTGARAVAKSQDVSRLESYTPFPVEEMHEITRSPASIVRTVMVAAAIVFCVGAFALQTYSAVIAYPINSGGRPLFAWPAFMFVTFELTVLAAALGGFLTMLVKSGLPLLHQDVFDWDHIERASDDRFFLELAIPEERRESMTRTLLDTGAISLQERAA